MQIYVDYAERMETNEMKKIKKKIGVHFNISEHISFRNEMQKFDFINKLLLLCWD